MQQEYPVQVEWRAFDLRPGTPPEGLPRQDTPEQRIGQPVTGHLGEAAQEAGLVMKRAPITPYTRLAMEANEYAKERGNFDAFHKNLFKAFWEKGVNLGDVAVLQREAERSGLDPAELGEVLRERRYAGIVEQQVQEARAIGITGIPAFIVERYLFTGAQPYPLFQRVVEQVLAERRGEAEPLR